MRSLATSLIVYEKINTTEAQSITRINIREIIFTNEFMSKLVECAKWEFHSNTMIEIIMIWLWDDLDNPVQYIADLLWITNKKHDD